MRYIIVLIVLMSFIFNELSFAQDVTLHGQAKKAVLQELENIQKKIDPSHYQVEVLFKEFGGDTFEVRNFIINYRSNTNNPLYGYDYEIAELRQDTLIDTLIMMAVNKSFYVIITGRKRITERELPDNIDLGSYFENIRSNFIINDVFQPFLNASLNEISVTDSNNNYYLHRKMNDLAVRNLVINKQTLLPSMWSSVIKDQDFELSQVQEIYFSFSQNINSLPTTAFSIEKYLSAGYELIVSRPDTSIKRSANRNISLDKQNVLLNYPFILPDGDTIIIQNSTAKYLLLDFWYASCLPCLKALPELNQLAETYSDEGLEIIAINCFDKGIKEMLATKMKDKNIQIPLLFASEDLIKSLGISSFPTYFFITQDRKLELINGGVEGVKNTIEKVFNRN